MEGGQPEEVFLSEEYQVPAEFEYLWFEFPVAREVQMNYLVPAGPEVEVPAELPLVPVQVLQEVLALLLQEPVVTAEEFVLLVQAV